MSNLDIKQLPSKLSPTLDFARKYIKIIYFVGMALALSFLIFQINNFASVQPTEEQVTDKLNTVQRPHIDQASLDKIQQLQDQNVQVQSIFKDARGNPFSE